MKTPRSNQVALGTSAVALIIVVGVISWTARHDLLRSFERSRLPEAVEYPAGSSPLLLPTALPATPLPSAPGSVISPLAITLPQEINLAVPFTPQAPHGRWDPPYKEFCEEASVLMAVSYLQDETIPNAAVADQKMLAIKAFEEERFGYYEDTTAAETAVILREHYQLTNVTLVENPSAADLKTALAAGKLVILPAAGRLLGNPYYTPPGPLYHMLVIKGYTADGKFITNDPGTRRGADFLYSSATILNAMHDWRADGQVELGRKVVIVVG